MEIRAGSYWVHKKRGTHYKVLGLARMQIGEQTIYGLFDDGASMTFSQHMSNKLESEGMNFVAYQALKDGSIWVRPLSEFTDGRFVEHK